MSSPPIAGNLALAAIPSNMVDLPVPFSPIKNVIGEVNSKPSNCWNNGRLKGKTSVFLSDETLIDERYIIYSFRLLLTNNTRRIYSE